MKKTKKFALSIAVLVIMVVSFAFSISALNATGKCGKNATYTFDSATGELVISGTGAIAAEAFYKNQEIKNVIIGDGITEIGAESFSLTNIEKLTIGENVAVIGVGAFGQCKFLENVEIPNSVVTIEAWAFAICYKLSSITIGNGLVMLGNGSFEDCDSLISIDIPDNVKTIEFNAFAGCENLASVNIGNGLEVIEDGMFQGCSNLEVVNIGNNVTTIGSYAFQDCLSLESITIPKSITVIDDYAFNFCPCLSNVYFWGIENEWCNIEIRLYNSVLDDATIHFMEENSICNHNFKSQRIGANYMKSTSSCKKQTEYYYSCIVCGLSSAETNNSKTFYYGAKSDHSWNEFIEVKSPTCIESGVKERDCKYEDCTVLDREEISALGHDMSKIEGYPATCTESGMNTYYACERCDKFFKDKNGRIETTDTGEIVAPYGHDYEATTDLKFETCTEDGAVEYVCHRCKDSYIKTIPATGHSYPSTWSVLITPDCQNTGFAVKVCFGCHDVIAQVVPKAGHADNDGDSYCDTCNCEIIVEEPENPDEPADDSADEPAEKPEEKPCNCDCHAGGIKAFFFKLINFFVKIFDKNARVCECGKAH